MLSKEVRQGKEKPCYNVGGLEGKEIKELLELHDTTCLKDISNFY